MDALIFKKYTELKNNKIRLLFFLILPLACFFLTLYMNIPQERIAVYLPLTVSLLSPLIFWSQENMYLSGDIILTPLSPKKMWIINSLINSISYYMYVSVCYVVLEALYTGIVKTHMPGKYILYGLLNLMPAIGVTLFASLSSVENTTIKQWIASPISLVNIFSFIVLLFFHKFAPIDFRFIIQLNLIGAVLIVLALVINKNIDNEKILIFSDKISLIDGSRLLD